MELGNQINLKPLIESYLIANTPLQLYRLLRGSTDLQVLARNNSIELLLEEYNRHASKKKKSIEDAVIAYSVLIAITFLEPKQALAAFDTLHLSRLDWGDTIKSIFEATSQTTNIFVQQVSPQLLQFTSVEEFTNTFCEMVVPPRVLDSTVARSSNPYSVRSFDMQEEPARRTT